MQINGTRLLPEHPNNTALHIIDRILIRTSQQRYLQRHLSCSGWPTFKRSIFGLAQAGVSFRRLAAMCMDGPNLNTAAHLRVHYCLRNLQGISPRAASLRPQRCKISVRILILESECLQFAEVLAGSGLSRTQEVDSAIVPVCKLQHRAGFSKRPHIA